MATRRGALIGCGFFALNHMNSWADLPGVEIVAVCDLDEARARSMAECFGIDRFYSDARKMMDNENPDFVDIVTTAQSHRMLVENRGPESRLDKRRVLRARLNDSRSLLLSRKVMMAT